MPSLSKKEKIMLNRKFAIVLISVFTAFLIIACDGGGGGGSSSGSGGPDVSPDSVTEAEVGSDLTTASLTSEVADSTTNTELTGTTSSSGEVIVEPEVNSTIEGETDTGSDTGTTTAAGDTDNSGEDTNNSVTNNTDSSTASEDAAAILAGGSDTTGDSDTGTDTTEGTSDTGSDTSSGDTASGSNGNGNGNGNANGNGGVNGNGNAGSDTSGAVAAGSEDSGAGNTTENLENDENVSQGGVGYSIDSSMGQWYEVAETELVSSSTASGIQAQIASLRNAIKQIRKNFKNGDITREEAVSRIKAIRKQIAELRASIGNGGTKTGGIVTYWANQNLFLNINSGESGWYRLVIVAKNQGILPDDYDRFSFSVEDGDGTIASISVKASDKVYYRGSAIIRLDPAAGKQLNILWTNDAYLKGKYDANVNIKKIALIKIKEPRQKLKSDKKFKGDQYSYTDGRWFFDKNDAYTYWADQVIGYTFKNMEEGQYEVTIEASNHGTLPLPKNYKEFQVEVDSEYDSASVSIKAKENGWQKETFTMNFPEGNTTLYLTWVNDSYKENSYDTNFKIKSIQVKKVKKSNLTAYLLKTKPGNRIFILSAFIMISAVLLGIYMKNRKGHAASA